MTTRIRCYTTINIDQTNVSSRRKSVDEDHDWETKRRSQANYDTLMQVVSLRALPENITKPTKTNHPILRECWVVEFDVQDSVYTVGGNELAYLISDCMEVPMISVDSNSSLMLVPEQNILFEKVQ